MKYSLGFCFLLFCNSVLSQVNFDSVEIDQIPSGYGSNSQVFDVEGDGDLDIVMPWVNGVIRWFENDNGTFTLNTINDFPDFFVTMIDNGNEEKEFYRSIYSADGFAVKYYNESNDYAEQDLFTVERPENGFNYMLHGDFNGDDLVDFVLVDIVEVFQDPNDTVFNFPITFYYNLGDNNFQVVESSTMWNVSFFVWSSSAEQLIQVIDMNNDGLDDLVHADYDDFFNAQLIYHKSQINNSTEVFQIINSLSSSDVGRLKFLSMEDDGMKDVFIIGSEITKYEQMNDDFIASTIDTESNQLGRQINFVDYDEDGDYDLISLPDEEGGEAIIYINDNGDFTGTLSIGEINNRFGDFTSLSVPGSSFVSYVSVLDENSITPRHTVFNLINNSLEPTQLNNEYLNINKLEAGDINGDSKIDFVVIDKGIKFVFAYFQNSYNSFGILPLFELPGNPDGIKLVDVDGDNDLDLLVVYSYDNLSFFRTYSNNGSGQFTSSTPIELPEFLGFKNNELVFQDINNDQLLDITISDESQGLIAWYKNMTEAFVYQELHRNAPVNEDLLAFDYGDLDGDGFPELVYSYIYACQFTCFGGTFYRKYDVSTQSFSSNEFISGWTETYSTVNINEYDLDNDAEVFMTSRSSNGSFRRKIYTFESGNLVEIDDPLDQNRYAFRPHDINKDGINDFFVLDDSNQFSYAYLLSQNSYDWTYQAINTFDENPNNTLAYADVDNNGEQDIIYFGPNKTLKVHYQGDIAIGGSPVSVSVNNKWMLIALLLLVFFLAKKHCIVVTNQNIKK